MSRTEYRDALLDAHTILCKLGTTAALRAALRVENVVWTETPVCSEGHEMRLERQFLANERAAGVTVS